MNRHEQGIDTAAREGPFRFQRPQSNGELPAPGVDLQRELERERDVRVRAEAAANRVAVDLTKEHRRRVRAELEAGQVARQFELARAQRVAFVGHAARPGAWRRTWRRLRHAWPY